MEFEYLFKQYGLEPMGLWEEVNLPENVRGTRRNKQAIIDRCNHMIQMCETMINRAKQIPEEDDDRHAFMVSTYSRLVEKAEQAVYWAEVYNG